jgi:uncharacterized membrane protein YesL
MTYTDIIPPFYVVTGLHVRVFALCVLIFPLLIYFPGVSLFFSVTLPSGKEMRLGLGLGLGQKIQFKNVDKNR